MKNEKNVRNFAAAKKFLLLAAGLMVSCGLGFAESPATAKTVVSGVSLSVTPGPNWIATMWFGPIPTKKAPQFAAWLETSDGAFVKTLAVTAKSGKNKWSAAPSNGRPEALPVWGHAVTGSATVTDATSSATPKDSETVSAASGGLVAGTEYIARFEVNTSFDYNDAWPKNAKAGAKNYSGVNGQPSVVYEARFVAGSTASVELKPVGQGSVDGTSGAVTPGFAGLTSALSLVDKVIIDIQ